MLIDILTEVPDNIFNDCLSELIKINWNLVNDHRKKGVFKTSTSIHLRSHDISKSFQLPNSIEEFSAITDCVDNENVVLKFPAHYAAAMWIKEQVAGVTLGRIMIVHLEPHGWIGIHKDPGAYFEKYSRYHIPLKTNLGVQFRDEHNNRAHMPFKMLCRLNNLDNHGLINDSDESRIHLIVDVETPGGNSVF